MLLEYNSLTIKRFLNPKNCKKIHGEDVYWAESGSISCGDILRLFLKINKKTLIITNATFLAFGCVSAFAASDLLCDKLKNIHIDTALEITNTMLSEELELPKIKYHCSILAEETLSKIIKDFYKKNNLQQTNQQINNINNSSFALYKRQQNNEIMYNKRGEDVSMLSSKKPIITISKRAFDMLKSFFSDYLEYILYIYTKKHGCGFVFEYKILNKEHINYNKNIFITDYIDFKVAYDHINISDINIDYVKKDLKSYLVIKHNRKSCFCGFTFVI